MAGTVKVNEGGTSFLVFKNCITMGENVRLKAQLLQQQQTMLQKEANELGVETDRALKQLAEESGIQSDEFENYQFNLQTMSFVEKPQESNPEKRPAMKAAPKGKTDQK